MGTSQQIQDLLLSLATHFIDPDNEQLDQTIDQALADLGQLVGADRAYLINYDWAQQTGTNTHEWCAPGVEPHKQLFQGVPLTDYSDWVSVHAKGDIICVEDVAAMPTGGLKHLLSGMKLTSTLALPLMDSGTCLGCVGFDGSHGSAPYRPDHIKLLGLFGRLLVDVRRKQQADLDLQSQRDTLQLILDHAPIGIWLQNGQGKVSFANQAFCNATGVSEEAYKSVDHYAELIPPDFRAQCLASDQKALASPTITETVQQLPFVDGRVHDLQVIKAVKRDAAGRPEYLVGLSVDITETLAKQRALCQSEERLRMALEATKQAWFEVDVRTGQVTLSPEYAQLIGHDLLAPQTSDMAHWQSQVHPDDVAHAMGVFQRVVREGGPLSADYRRATATGGWKWLRSVGKVAERDADGQPLRVVGIHTDIQQLKTSELQLHRMAHFDALTALPNRALLADRLQQGMAQTRRQGQRLAVLYIDLDGFKGVNDAHGHEAGDRYLQLLADRLSASLREGDTMARLGGDEFVAVLLNVPDIHACAPVLSRLLTVAQQSPGESGPPLAVSASIGLTFYPQAGPVDGDQLLRQADQAMYQAKLGGKNRFAVFDSAQAQETQQKHQTLERLQAALDSGELVLHFQPQVNMRSSTVVGAEALIRWQHPERGLLFPGDFLRALSGSPLAIQVGEWVMASALKTQLHWRSAGLDVPVSVNVDAQQLQHPQFVQTLGGLLAKHTAIRPGDLHLEIVESSELHNVEQASRTMAECAALGVRFALDDFGTGYASLTYLRRLPAKLIKIDQSFVRDMLTDPEDMALMRGAIGLASVFNRQVIAEGVETADQASALMDMGCDWGQGYGIARPMPGADLPAWASMWRAKTAPSPAV
jgi:diguanylate cyclase (GGDEF)-like protein/PAS domain S-box-containing protein